MFYGKKPNAIIVPKTALKNLIQKYYIFLHL